jgi:hypothetical protein
MKLLIAKRIPWGNVLIFKAPESYFVQFGGTSGKDVVLIADKQTSIDARGNYLTIDANGLSGYAPYSNYDSIVNNLSKQYKDIDKHGDNMIITSNYETNGVPTYGWTEYLKYHNAGIFISFQSEELSNPHKFDKIISTIVLK